MGSNFIWTLQQITEVKGTRCKSHLIRLQPHWQGEEEIEARQLNLRGYIQPIKCSCTPNLKKHTMCVEISNKLLSDQSSNGQLSKWPIVCMWFSCYFINLSLDIGAPSNFEKIGYPWQARSISSWHMSGNPQQQQQHSLLSQASWGRLEMKPKRDEKQGDTCPGIHLQTTKESGIIYRQQAQIKMWKFSPCYKPDLAVPHLTRQAAFLLSQLAYEVNQY
jgi:hypothetical protein